MRLGLASVVLLGRASRALLPPLFSAALCLPPINLPKSPSRQGESVNSLAVSRRSILGSIGVTSFVCSRQPKPVDAIATQEQYTPSDEVTIQISKNDLKSGLGLELADIEFRTNMRVYIKSVAPSSRASALGIQRDWIVVSLNGKSMERTNAAGVKEYLLRELSTEDSTVSITFRDPSVFAAKLRDLTNEESVTTQVAPAGDTTQRFADGSVRPGRSVTTATADQRVTVEQLEAPKLCNRKATTDDLMEISYTGSVVETGEVFDGSSVLLDGKGIPGRAGDTTIFFVLGKQPFGQFPPSWDVGLQGMCVGERRRLIIPPALGYGSTGVPRRKIPPMLHYSTM